MDASQLHDATIEQLHHAKMLMTSPEWSANIHSASG